MIPGRQQLGFPARNRPETHVAVAEWRDGRFDGSGGTNPARRFWTRLPVVLGRAPTPVRSFRRLSHWPTKPSKSGFDLVFSSKRPVVTEAEAGRTLVVEAE